MARQKEKMQVRIDSDLRPLVRQHAKEQSRSIPAEVNHRLRKAYEPCAATLGTESVAEGLQRVLDKMEADGSAKDISDKIAPYILTNRPKLKRSIGTSLLSLPKKRKTQ